MTKTLPFTLALILALAAPAWAHEAEAPTESEAPVQVHALLEADARPDPAPEGLGGLGQADVWLDGRMAGDLAMRVRLDLLGLPGPFAKHPAWLKDAYVKRTWGDLTVQAGQFQVPLVTEGFEPMEAIATIRRAAFNEDRLRFGNVSEPGVLFSERLSDPVTLETGLFAGWEANHPLAEGVVRLAVTPSEHFRLSVSHLEGLAAGPHHRTGVDAQVEAGPATVTAEAILGEDAAGRRLGWLGLVTWHLAPAWDAVAEVASWRPGEEEEREVTLGLNWHPDAHLQFMGNVIHQEHGHVAEDLAIMAWRVTL